MSERQRLIVAQLLVMGYAEPWNIPWPEDEPFPTDDEFSELAKLVIRDQTKLPDAFIRGVECG